MYKYIFYIAVLFLLPLTVSAAYNTVQFPQASDIYIATPNITLTVSAGSNVADITVNPTNVVFTLEKDGGGNSSITLTESKGFNLSNSASATLVCNANSSSSITLTGPSTIGTSLVTVTPTTLVMCTAVGGESASITTPSTTTGEVTATASGGGETTFTTTEGTEATIEVSANAVTADTVFKIASVEIDVVADIASAPAGKELVSAFDLTAFSNEEEVSSFDENIGLTLTYTDSQIADLDESTLKIYRWDGTEWIVLSSVVDADTNTITTTTTTFSYFAIIGEELVSAEPITEMTIEELRNEILRISALIAQVKAELVKLTGGVGILNTNLSYNDESDDVKLLQTWLAKDPEVYPEGIVSGWFGPLTKAAVIRFQEKYTDEILSFWELTEGTSFVGSTTRAKLNSLYSGQ